MKTQYPLFMPAWNWKLEWFAYGSMFIFVLNIAIMIAGMILGRPIQFEITGAEAVEQGTIATLFFWLYFFSVFAGIISTFILWISMWVYWARSGKSVPWFVALLFVFFAGHLFYYYFVYVKDLNKYLRIQKSIEVEKERMTVE